MTCEQINEDLSAYLDGELPAEARAVVESHLATCAECKALAEELKSIASAIHDLPRLSAPASLAQKVHDGVQTSPAPLLLISGAPAGTTGDRVQPRSMWGPVAFGIAAVVMLFLLAFAVMPALSNGANPTAMRAAERRRAYEAEEVKKSESVAFKAPETRAAADERLQLQPTEIPKKEAAEQLNERDGVAVLRAEKAAQQKIEKLGKYATGNEEGLMRENKPLAARKATLDAEVRKQDAPTNAAPAERALKDAAAAEPQQPEKPRAAAQPKQQGGGAGAANGLAAGADKAAPEAGDDRIGGLRRAKEFAQAPGAAAPTPKPSLNALPAAPSAPATAAAAPAPAPSAPNITPAPVIAPPPAKAQESVASTGGEAKQSVERQDKGRMPTVGAAKKSGGMLQEDAAKRGAAALSADRAGEGSKDKKAAPSAPADAPNDGGAPTTGTAFGGKPGSKARAGEEDPAAENRTRTRSEKRSETDKLKNVSEQAAQPGAVPSAAAAAPLSAVTFRTQDSQQLQARLMQLVEQHGGQLTLKGGGGNFVAKIPAAQRAAFSQKLMELQAQMSAPSAKGEAGIAAKREEPAVAEPKPTADKPVDAKKDEKEAGKALELIVVQIETKEASLPIGANAIDADDK